MKTRLKIVASSSSWSSRLVYRNNSNHNTNKNLSENLKISKKIQFNGKFLIDFSIQRSKFYSSIFDSNSILLDEKKNKNLYYQWSKFSKDSILSFPNDSLERILSFFYWDNFGMFCFFSQSSLNPRIGS